MYVKIYENILVFTYVGIHEIGLNVQNLRNYKNINMIFVSICKQLTQSEPMEFSKNGVFHSNSVVIFFQNDQIQIPTLP